MQIELRPSAAYIWTVCTGQPAFVAANGFKDPTSEYAAEGTAAHQLASWCLEQDRKAVDFLGQEITVHEDDPGGPFTFMVNLEMADAVQVYVDAVEREAYGQELLVEQRLDIGRVLELPPAMRQRGTADAVILEPDAKRIQVHDLKYGKGVPVFAEQNPQIMLYGLAALEQYDMLGDWERLRLVIHQPRLGVEDAWEVERGELLTFHLRTINAAVHARSCPPGNQLKAGDHCGWCPAKAYCPAMAQLVHDAVAADFEDLTETIQLPEDAAELGRRRALVPIVEEWCKAVTGAVSQRVLSGDSIPGFKLSTGRKGARKWADPVAAAERVKQFRLKDEDMFSRDLRSPAQIEGLLKPKQYQRLQDEGFIVQEDGKPVVVPEDSSKPEVTLAALMFEDLDDSNALL